LKRKKEIKWNVAVSQRQVVQEAQSGFREVSGGAEKTEKGEKEFFVFLQRKKKKEKTIVKKGGKGV